MVAMGKAFSKQDSLKYGEQIELFLKQFNLDEDKVIKLEDEWRKDGKSFALKYKFTKEELNEFHTKFVNLGMKAYAKTFMRDEQEIEQLTSNLKNMGREKFAEKFKFHDEEMTEFEKAVNDHFITLGRKAFADRYKLNPLEMDRLKSFIKRLSELEDEKTKRQIALRVSAALC